MKRWVGPLKGLGATNQSLTRVGLSFCTGGLLWCHSNDQLSTALSMSYLSRVGRGRLGERKHSVHDGPKSARLEQGSDLDQLLMIRLDYKECLFHPLVGSFFVPCRDGYRAPMRLEYTPRPLQSLAAHRVKHHIDRLDALLKAPGPVVDDLLGAQWRYEVQVARGGGGDHMGAATPKRGTLVP